MYFFHYPFIFIIHMYHYLLSGLKKPKKVHFTFFSKIYFCYFIFYKNPLTCTFFIIPSYLLYICITISYQGLRNQKKYISHSFLNFILIILFFLKFHWHVLFSLFLHIYFIFVSFYPITVSDFKKSTFHLFFQNLLFLFYSFLKFTDMYFFIYSFIIFYICIILSYNSFWNWKKVHFTCFFKIYYFYFILS